jgi:predicted ATPase/DNA-binding SARP family transcriptional activator
MLEVRLLGQFDVRWNGTAVSIPSRAAQSLLAYLLLTAGTAHRREKLAGLLWPDTTDENARKNLRHELWRLRKALETEKPRKKLVAYLVVDEISIAFDVGSDYWLDVTIVQKPLPKQVSADDLAEMLSLYHGELLPGLYDDWVVLERERVRAVLEQKMERLLELLIDQKRWQDTLDWGERWVALGQTPEPAYRALMVAHSALGNVSQVAAVYGRCVRAMRDDLGVDPSEQTRALFARLSKGERIPEISGSRATTSSSQEMMTLPEAHRDALFELPHPSLPRSRRLPVPLTSFIGRQREIEEVKDLLSSTRLLTLTGAGGVGKTRLAIELVRDLQSQYKDGAAWVDLVALTDPALVSHAVAKALGVLEIPNVPLMEALANALRSMQVLLVLDNCEHLVAACAQLAELLLGACASLKILATSREALGIAGETLWRVPSLSFLEPARSLSIKNLDQYESVRLFIERARTLKADFALTEQNALPIVQICQRLDGIPLAIELAAARVKHLSLHDIEKRLDDRFSLLTTGSRTALARQQTLRAAIDWSHDLLTAPERILFRRVSVFAGGFTLQAIEQVCAGDGIERISILQLLAHLVDKSLVDVNPRSIGGETRYRLLETIREYAREKLIEAGEDHAVRDRHMEFFTELATEAEPKLQGADQLTHLNRLEEENDNLRAALVWSETSRRRVESGLRLAAVLWRFWWLRGHLYEGRRWFAGLLSQAQGLPPSLEHAKALKGAGDLAYYQGDYVVTQAFYEDSLTMWRKIGDQPGIANSLNGLGNVAFSRGNYSAAKTFYEESLEIRRRLGDQWGVANSLCNLGGLADAQGDYASACSLLEQCLVINRELGDRRSIAFVLNNLGNVILAQGDPAKAHALQEDSLTLYRELGDTWGVAYSLDGLGDAEEFQGNYASAYSSYKESLTILRELGDKYGVVCSLEAIAGVAAILHQPDRTARLLGAAESLRETIGAHRQRSEHNRYDRMLTTAQALMDETAFAAAWAAGRAMTMEQAIAYALQSQ